MKPQAAAPIINSWIDTIVHTCFWLIDCVYSYAKLKHKVIYHSQKYANYQSEATDVHLCFRILHQALNPLYSFSPCS